MNILFIFSLRIEFEKEKTEKMVWLHRYAVTPLRVLQTARDCEIEEYSKRYMPVAPFNTVVIFLQLNRIATYQPCPRTTLWSASLLSLRL